MPLKRDVMALVADKEEDTASNSSISDTADSDCFRYTAVNKGLLTD